MKKQFQKLFGVNKGGGGKRDKARRMSSPGDLSEASLPISANNNSGSSSSNNNRARPHKASSFMGRAPTSGRGHGEETTAAAPPPIGARMVPAAQSSTCDNSEKPPAVIPDGAPAPPPDGGPPGTEATATASGSPDSLLGTASAGSATAKPPHPSRVGTSFAAEQGTRRRYLPEVVMEAVAAEPPSLIESYDRIPVLEQTKLPRGGVSVETRSVGRIQVRPGRHRVAPTNNIGALGDICFPDFFA
jgi:hypothetical protein